MGASLEGGEPRDLGGLVDACETALREAEDSTAKSGGQAIVPDEVLVSVPTVWLRGAVGWHSLERSAVEVAVDEEECHEPVVHAGRHALRGSSFVAVEGVDISIEQYKRVLRSRQFGNNGMVEQIYSL